jgi:predicted RNase H-like HicB family nuclease
MTYPENRLLQIYREQMSPSFDPDPVTLIRWADRIETLTHFNVARKGWTYEQAGTLADEVLELLLRWRQEMPAWVVETPEPGGTVLSRHVKAPTYEQALQLAD